MAFLGTSLFIATGFVLWWRFIRWTFRRVAGTCGVTAAIMGHLLLWEPLWDAGCVAGPLKTGQSMTALGLWLIVTTYLWWGTAEAIILWRKRAMSPYAVRVIYGMALIPFVPGAWFIMLLGLEHFFSPNEKVGTMIDNFGCGCLVVFWWWWVWRRSVTWTPSLIRRTLIMGSVYLAASTLAPLLPDKPNWVGTMYITLPLIFTGVWFALSTRMWQPLHRIPVLQWNEVKELIRCGSCGYSLIGLSQSRCPECGRTWTLDELYIEMLAARGDV
jgi:hypothetical protein